MLSIIKQRIVALILAGVMGITPVNFSPGLTVTSAGTEVIMTATASDAEEVSESTSEEKTEEVIELTEAEATEETTEGTTEEATETTEITEETTEESKEEITEEITTEALGEKESDSADEPYEDISIVGFGAAGDTAVYVGSSITYPNGAYSTHYFSTNANPGASNCNIYCIDPGRSAPSSGTSYGSQEFTNAMIKKAVYVSYGAPGFTQAQASFNDVLPSSMQNADGYYAVSHILISYAFALQASSYGGTGWDNGGVSGYVTNLYSVLVASDDRVAAPPSSFHVYWLYPSNSSSQRMITWTKARGEGSCYVKKTSTSSYISDLYNFSGIKYKVYTDSACTNQAVDTSGNKVTLSLNKTTGKSQTVSLAEGTYYIKETATNDWYVLDDTVHSFTVTEGTTAVVKVSDEPTTVSLKIRKYSADKSTDDNSAYSLKGAVYYVYTDEECTTRARDINGVKVSLTTGDEQTSSTGRKYAEASCSTLPSGIYYIKEKKASTGFTVDDTVYCTDDEDVITSGSVLSIAKASARINVTEEVETAGLRLEKDFAEVYSTASDTHGITYTTDGISSTYYSMQGAVYWVYDTKASDGSLSGHVGTFVVNSSGRGIVVYNKLDPDNITKNSTDTKIYTLSGLELDKTYYIKEYALNYEWNNGVVWQARGIRVNDTTYSKKTDADEATTIIVDAADKVITGSISLRKFQKTTNEQVDEDSDLDEATLNRKLAMLNSGYTSTGGTVYGLGHNIYTVYALSSANDTSISSSDIVGTFETKEYNNTSNLSYTNVRAVVTKNIYYPYDVTSSSETMHYLPFGYYLIRETKVNSQGYSKAADVVVRLTEKGVTTVGNPEDVATDEYEIAYTYGATYGGGVATVKSYEPILYGGIKLTKTSSNSLMTKDNSCYSLAGAVYDIYYYKTTADRTADIAAKKPSNGVKVGTFTTDEQGVGHVTYAYLNTDDVADNSDTLTCLPIGYYLCVETKAPEGYALSNGWDSPLLNSITKQICQGTGYIRFSSSDMPLNDPMGIEIYKEDAETGDKIQGAASLEGAQFTVKYYDGYYDTIEELPENATRTWVLETKYNEKVDKYACVLSSSFLVEEFSDELYDKDGIVSIPLGTITIEETKAPEGYNISGILKDSNGNTYENGMFISKITADDFVTRVFAGNTYTVKESVNRGSVGFTKIDFGSRNFMSGVAFRITSKDTGESHIIVTDDKGCFSTETIVHSYNTNGNDDAESYDNLEPTGIWFSGASENGAEVNDNEMALPYGTYILEELQCKANEGYRLLPAFEFTINEEGEENLLGNLLNVPNPKIETEVKDTVTLTNVVAADTEATIIDTVSYSYLTAGKTYTLKGTIIDQATGKTVMIDDSPITGETTFTVDSDYQDVAIEKCGKEEVTFNFDASGLAGKTLVVYEELYEQDGEEPIAVHKELMDGKQTFAIPYITTTATGSGGEHIEGALGDVTIKDTVHYTGFIPGYDYQISGSVHDAETGDTLKDSEGNEVTAALTFNAESEGDAVITYNFDASGLAGKTVVIYENVYLNGTLLYSHEDKDDINQQVSFPSIHTTARDSVTGTNTALAAEKSVIIDDVAYDNLIKSEIYTVKGMLIVKSTGKAVTNDGSVITSETVFKCKDSNGTVEMSFEYDATEYEGESIVVFEEIYHNGHLVARHADLNDEGQTITYTPPTKVTPPETPKTPKTGDCSHVILIIIAATIAGTGIIFLAAKRRKEK